MQIGNDEGHTRNGLAGNSSEENRNGQKAGDLHAGDERVNSND